MTTDTADYRDSHTHSAKPAAYNAQFGERGNVKQLYWQLERDALDKVLPANADQAGRTLVDFACGTGRVLGHLASRFNEAIGVDISAAMVEEAKQHVDARFLIGDVTRDTIDIGVRPEVISSFRFFLNAQPALRTEVLRWMHSTLRDEGQLVCNFHLNPHSLVGAAMNTMKRLRGWQTTPMMTVNEARRLLSEEGFQVQQIIGYGFFYYGRHRVWAPVPILLPAERFITACGFLRSFARNFLIVATKR